MASFDKKIAPKRLDFIWQNDSILIKKVELLAFYNEKYSELASQLLILIEHLQLISKNILAHFISDEKSNNYSFVFAIIVWFFKIVDPSCLLSFQKSDALTTSVLFIILCFTIFRYILSGYVLFIGVGDWKKSSLFISLWKVLLKIQGRIMCFFITSFCFRTIETVSRGEFMIFNISSWVIIAISSIIITLEYLASLFIEIQFSYILPTKNFSSSKDCQLQVITLIQKLILQIFGTIFKPSLTSFWIFDTLNFIISLIRCYHFYKVLPLYKFEALFYQGDILCIINCLNLSCLFKTILETCKYSQADFRFIIISWLIMSILMIKISQEYLKNIIIALLTTNINGPPELLLHKVNAMKQLRRNQNKPTIHTERYKLTYLLDATKKVNLKQVFGLSKEILNSSLNKNIKKEDNKLFLEYLKELSAKFPQKSLLKLHYTQQCAKDSQLYTKAIRILVELKRPRWSNTYLSSMSLLRKIQNIIVNNNKNSVNFNLDLSTYIQAQTFMEELKNEINVELDLRVAICNNIVGDVADIGKIFNCAQLINKAKTKIQKKISLLPHKVPDYCIESLIVCAHYYLMLGYAIEDYKKYTDMYSNKLIKYEKYFKDANLTKENIFQDTNAFLLLSGQKVDNGKITYCTKSIKNICGGDKKSYERSHIFKIFTPSFRIFYTEAFKSIFEADNKSILNKKVETYLQHKDNHIVKAEFYLSIHPYIDQNLYLNMIIRLVPSTGHYVLIRENGDIEGASKDFWKIFGITQTKFNSSQLTSSLFTNIKFLSEKLYKLSQAFNTVSTPGSIRNEKKLKDEEKRFEEMIGGLDELDKPPASKHEFNFLQTYNTKTQTQETMPNRFSFNVKKGDGNHLYWCNITTLSNKPVSIKIITLEEAKIEEEYQYREEITGSLERVEMNAHENKNNELVIKEAKEEKDFKNNFENIECNEKDRSAELERIRDSRFHTNDNLLSPKSNNTCQGYSPFLSFKAKRSKFDKKYLMPDPAIPNEIPIKSQTSLGVKKEKADPCLASNYTPSSFQGLKLERIFRIALNTKSYPKSFNILCILFYGVILITLASQFILKITTDKTMDDLVLKKNLLNFFQLRFYRAVVMEIVGRGGSQQITGELNIADMEGSGSSVTDDVAILESYRKDLALQNKGIIRNLDSLESNIRDKLFATDIRMRGSSLDSNEKTQKNVTHFILIDEIISAVRRLASLSNPVSWEGYHAFTFIFSNILDDFIWKCNEITQIFLDSVQKQKSFFEGIISLGMTVTPLLLVGITLMLTLIIWKDYFTEKENMLAFIKLDQIQVKNVMINLKKLKKCLCDEENFENINSIEFYHSLVIMPKSNYWKKSQSQLVKLSKTRGRYFNYTLQSIFYITVLISITIWNFISAQNSTKVIYKRQSQLEFANHISTTVTVMYAAYYEIFASNNTNLVQYQYPMTVMLEGIDEIKRIQSQAAEKFSEEDKSYDSKIEAIVFKDSNDCQKFSLPHHKQYCKILVERGQRMSLISLLSGYELRSLVKVQDYLGSDKSSIAILMKTSYLNIVTFLPNFSLIAVESQILSQIINNNLELSISDAQSQRTMVLIIFSFSLVAVSLLIWFQILIKLREINNDFKKVIQVFPSKLVLSSFLLKTFLNNNSAYDKL